MGNFTYEVVADYAEKDTLKVRAVAYNGREAKFDIRHWSEKNGEEVMGKGVTLTLEELMWLAEKLPSITKAIMDGEPSDDEPEEEPESNEEESSVAIEFMRYVVESTLEKPDCEGLYGIIDADGASYASNREVIVKLNESVDMDQIDDNPKLRAIVDVVENANMKGLNIGEINKFKAVYKTIGDKKGEFFYSFGKGKPTINARYLGKAIEAFGMKIRYDDNGLMSVANDKGISIIQPMTNEIEEVGLIEV